MKTPSLPGPCHRDTNEIGFLVHMESTPIGMSRGLKKEFRGKRTPQRAEKRRASVYGNLQTTGRKDRYAECEGSSYGKAVRPGVTGRGGRRFIGKRAKDRKKKGHVNHRGGTRGASEKKRLHSNSRRRDMDFAGPRGGSKTKGQLCSNCFVHESFSVILAPSEMVRAACHGGGWGGL